MEYEVKDIKANASGMARELNQYAAQGWRVVQVIGPFGNGSLMVILER